MSLSIEDAIDLHRCIDFIKDIGYGVDEIIFGIITIKYNIGLDGIIIQEVLLNNHVSEKAKELIQNYFDEEQNEEMWK